MDAPEFAQSDKLRRVFSALENRAYLGNWSGASRRAGRIQVFIGHENTPIDMRDVSLVLAPYGRPGRAIGVVGVLGPTRHELSQAIGTVRFVSGLMNELVDHLVCLSRKTRAQERVEEIDVSPTTLLKTIDELTAALEAARRARGLPAPRSSANVPSSSTSSAARRGAGP